MSIPIIAESFIISAAENQKIIIENLEEASKYDIKSEKHLKEGNYEKAAYCAILSQEHLRIASEAKREDIKLHSVYN